MTAIVTPNKNRQVCGSDGKTYESECHLKLQACRTQDDIVVQAFGPCKLGELAGTAGPPRPSSPIQFTQQDDGAASKSTRHLLNPDKYYNKYDWTRKETPSDFDGILSGQKFKGMIMLNTLSCLCFVRILFIKQDTNKAIKKIKLTIVSLNIFITSALYGDSSCLYHLVIMSFERLYKDNLINLLVFSFNNLD